MADSQENFRAAAVGWGNNTQYPFLPQQSPFEYYSKNQIEEAQSNLAGFNSVMYYPVNWLATTFNRPTD